MTAATSRMSPDTARVSEMSIHSMTRVTDYPCLYRTYLFSEQWPSSVTASIIYDVDYAYENTYNYYYYCYYLLQLGCHPVAVVILHVNKT